MVVAQAITYAGIVCRSASVVNSKGERWLSVAAPSKRMLDEVLPKGVFVIPSTEYGVFLVTPGLSRRELNWLSANGSSPGPKPDSRPSSISTVAVEALPVAATEPHLSWEAFSLLAEVGARNLDHAEGGRRRVARAHRAAWASYLRLDSPRSVHG